MNAASSIDFSYSRNVKKKVIAIIRHGRTECNEHLSLQQWGSNNFKDPEFWDTVLTPTGRKQAEDLNHQILNGDKHKRLLKAELIVSSPLTRALQTTELIFKNTTHFNESSSKIPKIVLPMATERVYMSSDAGRSRQELEKEFPLWDFSHLPTTDDLNQEISWWYRNKYYKEASRTLSDTSSLRKEKEIPKATVMEGVYTDSVDTSEYTEWRPKGYYAIAGEPRTNFRQRMINLRQWLVDRPEKFIVLTSHWGVARALTGASLVNCEVIYAKIEDILEEPSIHNSEY